MVQLAPSDSAIGLFDRELRQHFPASTMEAGRIYALRGRVRNLRVANGGTVITAETQGSAMTPYTQRITLAWQKYHGLQISGACSCPVGRGCKHLAAVLFAAARQHGTAPVARPVPVQARLFTPPPPEAHLPYAVTAWLEALQTARDNETETYPDTVRNRLVYVLGPQEGDTGAAALAIRAFTVTHRKDGAIGTAKPYAPHQVHTPARYLRPSDRLILTRLARRESDQPRALDDEPADTLRRIIGTGRAFWQDIGGPGVTEGPPRAGRIGWRVGSDGAQHPMLDLDDDGLVPLLVPTPWYAEPGTGIMGIVTLDMPEPVAVRLLSAPPIPPELVPRVRAALAERLPSVPSPNELPSPERLAGPVRPCLRLINGTLPADPTAGRGTARHAGMGLFAVPLARLGFGYGPVTIPCNERPQPRLVALNGRLYEPQRDPDGELAAADRLAAIGFGRVSRLVPVYYEHAHTGDFALMEADAGVDWIGVVTRELPKLRAEGWTVEIDDDFPIQVLAADSAIDAELIEGSGIDWLELHLGVMVDDQRIDLVPALIRLLAQPNPAALVEGADDHPFALPLPDGRLLTLPLGRIRPTFLALIELFAGGGIDAGSGRIGFTRLDAADLAMLEERADLVWRGGDSLRALGRQLREAGGAIPGATVPATFRGALRPYQARGVDWLQFLRGAGLGGVLADDMGLGKTVQTLAHLMIEKAEGRLDLPALIVCPTSLVPNWLMESERFAPDLRVLPLHGPGRKDRFREIGACDLVLTTYPLLTRDHATLTAQDWHAVILDEAQTIKNPNAETTRQALRLKARQRLCLSGTPLQNHLGELWSLFDFLAPGFLGSQRGFRSRYRTPIEKHGDAERSATLTRRVRPFLLRRTKEEVVLELPPKTEITEPVEMEPAQRAIYEGIRLAMHTRVKAAIAEKGLARSGIIILDALLKMRQACCDPRLLKLKAVEKTRAGTAKLDRLMDMLTIMLAEGRRILLFSQFTEMLALIERRLWESEIGYVMLTGDTRDRATPVRRFQQGEVPLFLISLKAGGVGLNLTAADTVIHYDPWWNPAVEDQATDRAHRIGQDKKVFVHRLVTLGTIEEKMETLKEKKRTIVASVLEAERGGALRLTEDDVEALFAAGD